MYFAKMKISTYSHVDGLATLAAITHSPSARSRLGLRPQGSAFGLAVAIRPKIGQKFSLQFFIVFFSQVVNLFDTPTEFGLIHFGGFIWVLRINNHLLSR